MTSTQLPKHWIVIFAAVCVFAAAWPSSIRGAQPSSLPHLRKQGAATQLIVDSKPFLVLGGELGNSSSSSLEYMRPVWPKLVALNLNTVLVPVYWELIEPAEGKFDFTLVDGLIQEARKHGLRLAPLILDHQGKNEMAGFLPEGPEQRAPQQARLGGYTLNVTYERQPSSATQGPATQGAQTTDAISGGLAIAVGPDEFIFAGTGLVVTFEANTPEPSLVGILSAQEGKYAEGQWQPGRWLNGDQTHQGRHLRLPPGKFDIQRIKLYRYR